MKELVKRRDGPALRDTAIWLAAFIASGVAGYFAWGTWWAVPCFLVYGVLYGGSTDSRWHECGHGTAFKTRWLNEVVYQIACFMVLREPTVWKWSHTRHHTDTIIVGRDPEIAAPRPPDIAGMLLNVFALKSSWAAVKSIALHVTGRLSEAEQTFIPKSEYAEGLPRRPHLDGDLRRRAHPGDRDPKLPAAHVCRPADALWRLVRHLLSASPSTPASPRTCSTTGSTRAPST